MFLELPSVPGNQGPIIALLNIGPADVAGSARRLHHRVCRVARQLATPRSLHLLIYVLRDIKLAIYCPGFVRDGAAFIFTTLLRIQFAITLLFIPASHVFTPWFVIHAANPLFLSRRG